MHIPKISIVIPAYNAEKYIQRCLASCLAQTIADIEMIVVDDCSNDDTVQKVAQIDDARIKLIRHKRNKGCGGARNTGIEHAQGEYLGFVDADDTIEPDFCEKLLQGFHADDIDIVMGSFRIIGDRTRTLTRLRQNSVEDFSAKLGLLFNGSTCDKLYRSSLIFENNLRFYEGCYWEDNLFRVMTRTEANKRLISSYGNEKQVYHSF